MNGSNVTAKTTAVVQLTSAGRAAIAVILVEGSQAVSSVSECFLPFGKLNLSDAAIGKIIFGHWLNRSGEEVVVVRRTEHSVEVHCHGGVAAPANVCESLVNLGCMQLSWAQWSEQKHSGPISIAATQALTQVKTERTAAYLLSQLDGALAKKLEEIKHQIESDEIESAIASVQSLLKSANFGQHLTKPWRIVLSGRTNVGKSSLINAILGYERSIVFDSPGTTRDVVTAQTAIDGWPVELIDTAGLRDTDATIESAGIELAKQKIASADLLLLVIDLTSLDPSNELLPDDQHLIEGYPQAVCVYNKRDLASPSDKITENGIRVSATCGTGIQELIEVISKCLIPDVPNLGEPILFIECQEKKLSEAEALLQTGDTSAALLKLNSLLIRCEAEDS